eukprot:TRINITY_DN2901_c0_g2_i1.p2 TRINITY_DN2901_c0_g2~~TRINITY_DN2901_c0_g2_i1.p2  ORF type:complete len:113 (+),score=17.81 TRINITY_DN2901_c0_g2_i1:523-861(+)
MGYSQGSAAATRLLNELCDGRIKHEHLEQIFGAVFLGCPKNPGPSAEVGHAILSLHCNGGKDPLTGLDGAKAHAAKFKDSTVWVNKGGGHEVSTPYIEPIRQFLLRCRNEAT